MDKKKLGMLFVLLASLLLSGMYIPGLNPIAGDKEIYRYIARVMLKGGVPYRDVFDHKPPLIFFLNYAAILLGGDWGQWFIDAGLALLATAAFYGLCRRHRLPFPWILPLLFNLMIRDHLLCLGIGMTREYTAMLLLLFFCILMGKHRYCYYGLGFVGGLIFFMQQDQVLALIPLFLYATFPGKNNRSLLTLGGQTMAGFLLVALPILAYFGVHHSLGVFWEDAFRFNATWYTHTLKESNWDHWRKIKATLDQGNYELPVMVGLILGTCSLFFRHSNKRLLLLALATVVLSISTEFMGGRDIRPRIVEMGFTHYFLPLAASIPILLFTVFAFSGEPAMQSGKAQLVYGILVCASLAYTDLQHAANHQLTKADAALSSPEMQYIRLHRPGDYKLFVFFDNNAIYSYNDLGIIGPSYWVYQHFWELYDNWDPDHAKLRGIEQELLAHQTTYIMNYGTLAGLFRDPGGFRLWHAFLLEHYVQIPLHGNTECELWKWKDAAE